MKTYLTNTLAFSSPALLFATSTEAEFIWDGEIELGNEQIINSDAPANEVRDTFLAIDLNGVYSFANGVEFFAGIAADSVSHPTNDRTMEDIGVYVHELGFRYSIRSTTITVGKVSPAFGQGWDVPAGFFGTSVAADYEMVEQIGLLADFDLGEAGVLSAGVFFLDISAHSDSWGHKRGRNSVALGGAGNTGKLDNFAVAWNSDIGNSSVNLGARFLSAGVGDVGDETGLVAGLGHSFASGIDLFGEIALFDNFAGSADSATFATLNAAYSVGDWSISGTLSQRDLETQGETDLFSLGTDYTFGNGASLGGAVARVDNDGVNDTTIGISLVVPLNG